MYGCNTTKGNEGVVIGSRHEAHVFTGNMGGVPLAFLSCDMTRSMEVMRHDDIANFCLAAPWYYAPRKGIQ